LRCTLLPVQAVATLRQKVKPGLSAPGLDSFVKGVCKRQLMGIIEDIHREVDRLNKGMHSEHHLNIYILK